MLSLSPSEKNFTIFLCLYIHKTLTVSVVFALKPLKKTLAMELQFLISFFVLGLLFLFLVQYLQYHRRHHLPPSPQPCLPIIGHLHLLGPLVHQSLYRVSLRYGPLFSLRFGSVPCIIASTPYFAKQLLQANELSFSSRIETTAVKRLTYESSLAFAPYGPYWRFIKKLSMNELLGTRAINHFQHLRAQEYDRLLKLLAQKAEASEAVNMTEELLKLTNNVISMMMLGEAEEASAVVREVTKIFGEFNVSDFIWLFKKLDFQGFGKRIEDLFHTFDTLVERVISKRQQMRKNRKKENGEAECKDEGTELRDFLDILLDYMEDESSEVKIDRVHIKALIMDFFTAGTDTTSIATEWALVELMNHPKVLQKARDEIDNVVGKSRVVEEGDVANLPYIKAITKETFRLHPPVPLVTRRCVAECKIENYIIPDNSLLFVNVWAIGRDPNYWDSPLDFRPERFLNPNERDSMGLIDVRGQHFQLLPFGSGRRMCPGVSLAMQEVPALLAAIIQCFDFQVVGSNSKGETEKLKGESYAPVALLDMDERPGLTAPRAHNLVCFPFARPSCSPLKILS